MEGNVSKGNDSGSKSAKIDGQVVPDDLVNEILVRLPVKPLVRFKLVSKWWYQVITSPLFIENQFKHGSKKSRMLMVMSKKSLLSKEYAFSFYELDSLQQKPPLLSIYSFMNMPKSPIYVHCLGGLWSKGILCIMYNNSIRLCNPALRESKLLPPRPSFGKRTDGIMVRGFGITKTGEFKVILIRESFNISKRTWTLPAHLYSSSTNSWKRIADAPQKPCLHMDNGHVAFFNGACHWPTPHILLSFDTTNEVFGELELPYDSVDHRSYDTYPVVINDFLAVVKKEIYQTVEVWVMKEYGVKESWTKQFVIQLQPMSAYQMNITLFSSWKNDEWLLFLNRRSRRLVCVSFLTREIKDLRIDVGHNISGLIYEESLVSLN